MSRLKTLVRNERGVPPLRGGHSLCQGGGVPLVVRTGCLEVATTRDPTYSWKSPGRTRPR